MTHIGSLVAECLHAARHDVRVAARAPRHFIPCGRDDCRDTRLHGPHDIAASFHGSEPGVFSVHPRDGRIRENAVIATAYEQLGAIEYRTTGYGWDLHLLADKAAHGDILDIGQSASTSR